MDLSKLERLLHNPTITSDMILGRAVCSTTYKSSPVFKDTSHYPFYYHFGRVLNPKTVLQVGAEYGLIGRSFLEGCEAIKEYLIYYEGEMPFVERNIKEVFKNLKFADMGELPNLDLCMIVRREQTKDFLQEFLLIWDHISCDGFLLADYISTSKQYEETFRQACDFVNRKPTFLNTRYGAGLVQK